MSTTPSNEDQQNHASVLCPVCGNPRVDVSYYSEDIRWTGVCTYCGTIVNPDKSEVIFHE